MIDDDGDLSTGTRIKKVNHWVVPSSNHCYTCGSMDCNPVPTEKLKEYLHTTNSQTEEEVGGCETKQLDAKIQSVKITACKDTHMFVIKNISLRV